MNININISSLELGALELIGRSGKASSGYSQDTLFCIHKAVDEFIIKYTGKEVHDLFESIEKELKQ